jgi:TPR repeat protein
MKNLSIIILLLGMQNFLQAQQMLPFSENNKWGFRDGSGTILIQPIYSYATPFDNGLAAVKFSSGKFGAIDKTGKTIFELRGNYTGISAFHDGFTVAYTIKKVFIIDRSGKIVNDFSAPLIQNAKHLGEGIIGIASTSNYWAYFTIKGVALTKFAFNTPSPFKHGKTIVYDRYNPVGGLMDTKGRFTINVVNKDFKESVQPGQYIYKRNEYPGKYNVVDETGKLLLQTDYSILKPTAGKELFYSETSNPEQKFQLTGLLDQSYNKLTAEIFPIWNTVYEQEKIIVTINKIRYLFDATGKPETIDGSYEYAVADLLLPGDTLNARPAYTWEQIDQLLLKSAAKGYEPAKKRIESIASIPFYHQKLTSLRVKSGSKDLDSMEVLAKKGDTATMLKIATAYLSGTGRQKDSALAISWLEKAIIKKSSHAAQLLSTVYINSMRPELALKTVAAFRHDSICASLFIRLSNAGAMDYFKGYYYDSIAIGLKDRYAKALEFYTYASAAGNNDAVYVLALKQFNANEETDAIKKLAENASAQHLKSIEFLYYYYLGLKGGSITEKNKQAYSMNATHYLNQLKNHPDATEKMLAAANRNAKKDQADMTGLNVGTVIGVPNASGIKKVITSTSLTGFYTNDGVYYSAKARNAPAAYKGYVVLAGESDLAFRKTCGSCNGHKTINKQVKSGSFVTKDVTYKTGSNISGDKKITTYTEHNTFKTISDQCDRCNGRGYTY